MKIIISHKPDLLFLDIEMQTGTGFDLLEQAKNFNFEVVFTTAFEHYALKAIKFSAIDYLIETYRCGRIAGGGGEGAKEKKMR